VDRCRMVCARSWIASSFFERRHDEEDRAGEHRSQQFAQFRRDAGPGPTPT
jgi:hypothetical protein